MERTISINLSRANLDLHEIRSANACKLGATIARSRISIPLPPLARGIVFA